MLNLHQPHGKGVYRIYFSISIYRVCAWYVVPVQAVID
jgi:hypothetical protein